MPKRAGRPSVAQTPAPKKNPKGSATEKKAKSIQLSDKTINTLKEKLDTFKKSHPSKKNITLSDLKAVYRRGSGAYSSSHRPTITGGAPNSRAAWSYARVNKFLKKAGGAKVKAAYVQDDDLFANGGVTKGGDCYEAAAQFCMGFMPEPVEFVGEPHLVHAEVKGQGKAEGIRFGHAWVEDDENVYDYSNGRRIVMPKVFYYAIGDIQTDNPLKYQRYTFPEARAKMLKTKHYGSWDIETEYADGGNISDMIKSVNLDKNIYEQNIEYHSIYPKINSKEYTIDSEQILKENFIQSFLKNVEIDSDNNITAYRLLALDDISDLDKDNLGIYWACSEDKVVIADDEGYEHEKKSYKNKYLIKVKANIKDINWQDTFELYVINDWMEGEIRFIKSTKPVETYYKKIGDTKWVKLKNEVLFADGGLMAREDYTKDALEFFKKELGIKSDVVLVQSQSSFDPMSMSQLMGSVTPKKDNKFYVAVNFNETKNRFIRVLAHELVHVKQMEDERLRFEGDKIIFDDEKMTYDEYQKRYYSDDIPKHEEEAFNLERVLQSKYMQQESNYADGGLLEELENSLILAPNGNISNLTPEQYKLVRTPEFKAWFGDWENDPENASKVVDENGEPMVVYHGSRSEFTIFDINKSGESSTPAYVGFWFTPIKKFAYNFASTTWYGTSDNINVYPLFLSIKNPKIYNSDIDSDVRYPDSYQKFKIDIWALDGQDADRANVGGMGMMLNNRKETIKKYRELLENEGFDGIFINKTRFDKGEAGGLNDQIVALFPNQIKYADGTNKTFDMNNPDIRYATGGRIFPSRLMIPSVRGGWTKEKILRYLKSNSSDTISTYTLAKFISDLDSWEELKDRLYYHGTTNYIEKGLKPSIVFSERWAEKQGGGGYGDRYWGISLTKRKRTAESFSGMSSSVKVYPVFLKKDANVIVREDLQDASEIEDIIVELYENGIDAVWIGGGEEELVVVNPESIMLYDKGSEYFEVYGGLKTQQLTDEQIKEIYQKAKLDWENYLKEYNKGGESRKQFLNSLKPIKFEDGGQTSQLVTCINCSWEWETADSAEYDKYVCHQCGFDNSLFYDGGLLKPTMPLDQIAEKQGVSIEYLEEQLEKGMEHEKEHTDSDEVATTIALHHLAERPDYYEELEKMKLEDGGEVTISDEDYEFAIGGDENLGKAIKLDGVIVGGIAYDEDEQQIYGIVIKNKFRKKGVAKRAIKALFDKNPDLKEVYVRAVPESKGFWKKIGTDFDNYNEDAGLWEGYVKRFGDGGDVDLFGKIDISEDNSQEYEIEDFLKQQKEESHMVMTCDSSKIYKAMICKAKCEIADKRMSETENAEELNAWNSYKNIWNDCLQDIIDNNIEMYKAGGKTCGCGCGSIYSKGGMFSKGGLAYGNSHDKGGMPMKVKSTGQNIEIEGGEGVTNKRSMQMTKKVEFEGQKMTPCEVVSKINEMGGGVKFKCSDVKNIIEEDGHF